ncbi:hypothetical protein [Streptomyces sp. NPDC047024]|uniref:hypothetical protein n=1 Tax=Streptomyces sp. NPDC047024 TaxID=3155476 RepID=UPI0033CBE574
MTDFSPAGHDRALATALQELRAMHWTPARELLDATGRDWQLRTFRIGVLAATAQESTVVENWLTEEPQSYNALALLAAVEVERAWQAARIKHPEADQYYLRARGRCLAATQRTRIDPTPWVSALALSPLDVHRRYEENCVPHADRQLVPHGPWDLLNSVRMLDRWNRAAFHHGAAFVRAIKSPEIDFISWAVSHRDLPASSALHVLPLHAMLRQHAYQESNPAWRTEWTNDTPQIATDRAYRWFLSQSDPRRTCQVEDLSYLALALWASHRFDESREVFKVMERFASLAPWLAAAGGDEHRAHQLLKSARSQSFNLGRRSSSTRQSPQLKTPEVQGGRHAQPSGPSWSRLPRFRSGGSSS